MLRTAKSRRRTRRTRERGQAAVFLVLALGIFLIGGVGFVVDGANLWFHRQSAQTAADAACTAGAMDMLSQAAGANLPGSAPTDSANSYAVLNGYSSGVSVSAGAFTGLDDKRCDYANSVCDASDNNLVTSPYLQTTIADQVPTTFMRLVGAGPSVNVPARSTCGLSNVLSPVPILVLNPNAPNGAGNTLWGSDFTLSVYSGPVKSIQVNSTDNNAVNLSGTIDLSNANGTQGGEFSIAGRESENDAGVSSSVPWVNAGGIISDPFALVPVPPKPTSPVPDCSFSLSSCVQYGQTGSLDCPDKTDGCDIYQPGNYSNGILVRRQQDANGNSNLNATGLALFVPGVYYLGGNLYADVDSCLRSATSDGDGSGGTTFYFAGSATLNVTSNSGALKRPRTTGARFNCATSVVSVAQAECNGTSLNLPSSVAGFSGNVLIAPCTGTYGDPSGNGNQRGMLFFHDRDQAGNPAAWNAAGSFGLIGNLYFHYCASTLGAGNGGSCNSDAFTDILNLGSGSDAYVAGDIVVDQLQLGQGIGDSPITISLNPNPQYYVLKASLLQ